MNISPNIWLNSLSHKELEFFIALIGGIFTLCAALFAIRVAFAQLSRQFEHKIIYDGWQDLQQRLFDLSSALIDYDSLVQGLTYFVDNQDYYLVNSGNQSKYRFDKWTEITESYSNLQKAYIAFLVSYESHEIIFLPLKKMQMAFIEEYRNRISDKNRQFVELIFPEMSGQNNDVDRQKAKKEINDYWKKITEFSAFIDDCRNELQNVTVGTILNKRIPQRQPVSGHSILTKDGLITPDS